MRKLPTLQTPRLTLRPFRMEDAPTVQRLANDKDIATNTQNLPHPYEEYMAKRWISLHQQMFDNNDLLNLAVVVRKSNELIGAIGYDLDEKNDNGELGYWLGRPYWGMGYATEAARRLLHYGFSDLKFYRVHSCHLTLNPASGNVLKKIGMSHEGQRKGHIKKWGKYEDLELYGILVEDYHAL
jgi:[ribosomal protein S5]-alanine N-acetyltransferase